MFSISENSFSLYIHWPFCRQKCSYCDLNSHVRDFVDEEIWISALECEIMFWSSIIPDYKIKSIFFGGGTPSLIKPSNIQKLIQLAKKSWKIEENLEITLETNPSSLESNSLEQFKKSGINRISFGVQSLNDHILKLLNRTHTSAEALAFIKSSLEIFNNVSVDIIYGLPNQTLEILKNTLDKLLSFDLQHISIYELTLQKNTLLYHQIENKELFLPNEDIISKEYDLIMEKCEMHNYKRYEISNFSKPGYESKHNQNYWRSKQFLGIGAGAHSRLFLESSTIKGIHSQINEDFNILTSSNNINNDANKYNIDNYIYEKFKKNKNHYSSFENIKNPEKWLKQVQNLQYGVKSIEKVSFSTQIQEFIMMGLRLQNGIKLSDFRDRFQCSIFDIIERNKLDKLLSHKYVKLSENSIQLTNEGLIRHGAICKYLIFND